MEIGRSAGNSWGSAPVASAVLEAAYLWDSNSNFGGEKQGAQLTLDKVPSDIDPYS